MNLMDGNSMFDNTVQDSLCDQAFTCQSSALPPHLPKDQLSPLLLLSENTMMELRVLQIACPSVACIMFECLFQKLSLCELRCRSTGRAKSKADSLRYVDKVSIHSWVKKCQQILVLFSLQLFFLVVEFNGMDRAGK